MRSALTRRGTLVLVGLLAAAPQPAPEAFVVRNVIYEARIDYGSGRLIAAMTLDLENRTPKPATKVSFILHRLMEASQVRDSAGAALPFSQDVVRFEDDPIRQVTQIVVRLPQPVGPGAHTTVRIDYAGYLTPYTEIGWLYVKDHIDTAFTIIRSDALAFPIVGGRNEAVNRRLPNEPFAYDASVRVPARYLVATGGTVMRTPHDDGTVTWRYRSGRPSPFLDLSLAPFDTVTAGGVRFFYFPADSTGARFLAHGAEGAMRTLSQWFGPLHAEAKLTINEIPDGWGSQSDLVGGIIQSAAAFRDTTRINELYHELTHLWNTPDLDVPSPRWNEGLASFLEDLMKERLNGWTGRGAYETRLLAWLNDQMAKDSTLRSVPFIDYGNRQATGWSYTVGNFLFSTLYDLVGAEEFNRIVGGYFRKYPNGGTTRGLVTFAKQTASTDLSAFFDDWMFTPRWTSLVATAASVADLAAHYRRPRTGPS